MRKLGCGCLVVLLTGLGLLIVVGTQNQPAIQSSASPVPPSVVHKDAGAAVKVEPAAEIAPPDADGLRTAYAGVVKILKQLDALAKRPEPDQFVAVAKLHRQLPYAMSLFDDLIKRSPSTVGDEIGQFAGQLLRWHMDTIPTDSSAEQIAATRKLSERMYVELLDAAKQWNAGPKSSTSVDYRSGAESQVESKIQSLRLYAFTATLDRFELDNSIIESTEFDGDTVTITVAQAWHLMPYQFRLQAAQSLYLVASQLIDNARLELVDINGNRVGGSGMLDHSAIDVVK